MLLNIEDLGKLTPIAQVIGVGGLVLLVMIVVLIIAFSRSGGYRLSNFLVRTSWFIHSKRKLSRRQRSLYQQKRTYRRPSSKRRDV